MIEKILIPIDWSIHSEEVSIEILLDLLRLAEKLSPTTYFLHVVKSAALPKEDRPSEEEELEKEAKEYFNKFENKVLEKVKSQVNIHYEFVIKKGNPAKEICKFAEEEDVNLIAMASHGDTGIARWALGSVAYQVVHYSKKPVLLLPRRK